MTDKYEKLDTNGKNAFKEAIAHIAKGERRAAERIKLIVTVSGGAPSQRFESRTEVNASGRITRNSMDQLNNVLPKEYSGDLAAAEVNEIFQKLSASGMFDQPQKDYRIVPDSLVGTVVVEVGGIRKKIFFPVEEEDSGTKAVTLGVLTVVDNHKLRIDSKNVPLFVVDIYDMVGKFAKRLTK